MKPVFLTLIPLFLLSPGATQAGETSPLETNPPPAVTRVSDASWEFTLSPYAWGAGLDGTVGIRGFSSQVDLPVDQILKNLDMIGFLSLEARRGRLGGWIDGAYLKLSGGPSDPRPLFDSVSLQLEQLMVEGALFYRLFDGPRGYLDVYGGARYLALRAGLSLGVSDSGVADVSSQLSSAALEQLKQALQGQAKPALQNRANQLIQEATNKARDRVTAVVTERVDQARNRVDDIRQAAAAHPILAEILRNSERFEQALEEAAKAQIQQRLAELQLTAAEAKAAGSAARLQAQAAAGRARSKADKAFNQAQKQLTKAIASTLREAIPSQISGDVGWVDPFIGLRAQYRLTDRLYAVAKGDVGGFGVSSDFTWQGYGALGCHLNARKSAAVELGYRHLAVDYQDGGFIYDVALSGVMLSLGFKF